MKRHFPRLVAFLIVTTLFAGKVSGQQSSGDSTVVQASLAQVTSNFYIALGQQSRLFSGKEYQAYDRNIKGTALYPLDAQSLEAGTVKYDGFTYTGVPMMYDIYQDELVALLYNHFSLYCLNKERVSEFSFAGHHFVRLNTDTILNDKSGLTTGFYEQLYSGKTEVLARHIKTIQHSTSMESAVETFFLESHDYFLKKGNTWYKVDSQGAFYSVLKDKKQVLQKYLRDNNITFRETPELAMAMLAAYYDRL